MGMFASSQSVRLTLPSGNWIEIKKELSYGDMQDVADASEGKLTRAEMHFVASYLLDWSLLDEDQKPVRIDAHDTKLAALRWLTPQGFQEIDDAINEHAKKVVAAKKPVAPRGGRRSARISASAA